MPVSTDGVLLGAWSHLPNSGYLLDIGTGTGLLALMSAQRSLTIDITAIDIDEHALAAAQKNFTQSNWSTRLHLISGDVLEHQFERHFDAIICNPPYFNNGEQSHTSSRATARHTDTLSHSALLNRCWELLSDHGSATFVLPKVEGEQFIELAKAQGWSIQRICYVRPTERKEVNRLLFQLGKSPLPEEIGSLTIHDQGGYSAEFIALTKDFYLKM